MGEDCRSKVVLTQEHHRRPISLGGKNDPANVSYVRKKEHTAWHVLFGNMNSFQVCDWLNAHSFQLFKSENILIECKFINGSEVFLRGENNSKNNIKTSRAWNVLFKNSNAKSAISYTNNVWLDPSYHLYIKSL